MQKRLRRLLSVLLAAVLTIGVLSGCGTSGGTDPGNTGASGLSGYEKEVVRLVNVERAKYGLQALTADPSLTAAAGKRAAELTVRYSHTRPDGSSCFSVFSEYGIGGYHAAGENIAAGYTTPAQVVEGWMNSPGHRANILDGSFTEIGVGHATASDQYGQYWVQLFKG